MKLLLATIALVVTACVPVAPWQRGVLADRRMQWARDPAPSNARTHVLSVREGASGGAGGGGGACGCD